MQSFIYASSDTDERDKLTNDTKGEVSQFDLFLNNCEENPSIEIVRDLQSFLIRKPLQSPYNLAILKEAHFLSLEAQNALLKTLEEPPPASKLVLIVPQTHFLLPTIVSRCQIEESNPSQKDISVDWQLLETILTSKLSQRLKLSDSLEFAEWLGSWEELLKEKVNGTNQPLLTKLTITQIQNYLKKLLSFSKMTSSHVNSKLFNSAVLLSAPHLI